MYRSSNGKKETYAIVGHMEKHEVFNNRIVICKRYFSNIRRNYLILQSVEVN